MTEDDKYDVLETIGRGSFGIIRKVRRKSDGYILCRKEISYSRMSAKEKEQLQAELSILKELRHPNIVAYYEREHLKASQDLHLYMEYCGNGDLGKTIKNLIHTRQMAQEQFVWSILSQIVSALYRCHYGIDPPEAGHNFAFGDNIKAKPIPAGRTVLHRDLKPENIFLDHDNSVKLGDFGLSKILQAHDFASTYVGTPFYMSPEICLSETYSFKSDIWALGCIIYELCAKAPPFNATTHLELIQKIRIGRVNPLPSCYSPELQKVVTSCLQVKQDLRPTTADLLNLPVVKLMRKEQEVVQIGQQLRQEKELVKRKLKEADEKLAKRASEVEAIKKEVNDTVRREWEVKARLEIDRQVAVELERLRQTFEAEVSKRVSDELAKNMSGTTLVSLSPKLPPRSSTPTQLTTNPPMFSEDQSQQQSGTSFSTLGEASDFPSMTDLSSLSLDSPVEIKPTKRPARAPLTRARTTIAPVPPSPMDVQMADPSPMSIASLSLSPRKTGSRKNIFAAVTAGERWEPQVPSSPTEEWNGDFDGLDDDDLPVLPSPTRAKSAASSRNDNEDPFKVLANAQRPVLKPNQRLASAPNLFAPNGTKARSQSTAPVVATSPDRRKSKAPQTNGSPLRKGQASKFNPMKDATANGNPTGGLMSKKGNEQIRVQAMRNNLQGRTLVELQQARGIPVPAHAVSEDEGKKVIKRTYGSPTKVAQWDPDTCDDMPSPFLRKKQPLTMR